MDDWERDRELVKKPNQMHSGHQCERKLLLVTCPWFRVQNNCMREWYLGVGKGVLFREVS